MTTVISLSAGAVTLQLDPDLQWRDEFGWSAIEEAEERGITGALIVDIGIKSGGRPITLAPPDDASAWMSRATIHQLQTWEQNPSLTMTLLFRGTSYQVKFRRTEGVPIEAHPATFVANPLPGGFGDWYLTTLRFIEV
jgi:hypothetical protein